MLLKIAVERASACEMVDVATTVETEFLDGVDVFVFHHIEIAVVAIARHIVAIGFVPTCVFHSHVFSRNHFAVEEEVFRAIFLVVVLDEREDAFHKISILLVVADGDAEAFCCFDNAVHTDGEILALNVDVASIEEGEKSAFTHPVEVGIVGHLRLVHEVDDAIEIFHVVATFARGLLHAAVDVDGEHRLRTSAHTTCTEGVREAVVLDFIAQTAATSERVGIVAHIGEEGVAFGIHFCGEIAIFFVDDVAILAEQSHCFHGEGQDGLGAFGIKPVHKAFLQPREGFPVGA